MIKLTSKDAEFLRVFWPWGAVFCLSAIALLATGWIAGGADRAVWGRLFFVLLLMPFAWWGVAEYVQSTIQRGLKLWLARAVGLLYLALLASKLQVAFAVSSRWIPALVLVQLAATAYAWIRFSTDPAFTDGIAVSGSMPHHRWLEDVLMFAGIGAVLTVF
jgi:hypothetical protein